MISSVLAIITVLVAVLIAFQAWKRVTVSGNIYTLTKSCETLERSLTGQSKRAHDRLVKIGRRALPALRRRNERLIAEHVAYSEALKAGPSWNPYENYGQKSHTERRYRYVIETKQARVVDVIEEIEGGSSAGERWKYRNQYWGFELDLPRGWGEPDFFRRLLSLGRYARQAMHPEFYALDGSSIKIAIGPISPVPSAKEQRSSLEAIARRHGHDVVESATMKVGGRDHATMLCRVPGVGMLKNYSLIFGGIEYFVTAKGDWHECDSIVKTFKVA